MKSVSNFPGLFADLQNKEKCKLFLWDLLKAWITDPQMVQNQLQVKEMLAFYEDLKQLLELVYAPEPEPAAVPDSMPELVNTSEAFFLQLIESLKILVDPEMIFLFDLPNLNHADVSHRREVFVVLRHQELDEHHNTQGLFSFLASGMQEIAIHSINRNALIRDMGKGNLFFQYHLRQLQLIYRKVGVCKLKEIPAERLQERMLQLRSSLEKNWERADQFWQHALDEQENQRWDVSLFFLHQALELRLRGLKMAWEKRELKSHETRVLLRECYQFIPELSSVFPQDTEEEISLLQTLEDAYCKVRYKTEFPVEEAVSTTLSQRVAEVRRLCDRHFEHYFLSLNA
ncbi:HEPN domain-containing protein [Algoriphagus sp.]|uniref:HEPN domain-containing protein n=1 Tax=Algoriphagus sp. TaxID=1872435 RepID=UPI00271F6333|nr:HEPN domain-containing protein [Algoriphagus sp.]MDO8965055.1 HEPN domain-containing protein [Algoriphagus sp.]MDP3201864.1 HEPN domain-containing protein [Algoriphagus sp.]